MKNNIEIILRERGKIVSRTESHNIWALAGQRWLSQLVSLDPDDEPYADNRLRYLAFGIGGIKQNSSLACIPPMSTEYPGTNRQTAIDKDIEKLERPCRVHPGSFLKAIDVMEMPNTTTLRCITDFSPMDLSFDAGLFRQIPLSEVGLVANTKNVSDKEHFTVGYNTFPTIMKSNTHDMQVIWTIRL